MNSSLPPKAARRLLKARLPRSLSALFRQLTGLELLTWWHAPNQPLGAKALARFCPQAPCAKSRETLTECQDCQPQCWIKEWARLRSEGCFLNECGLVNFYACVRLREQPVVTLIVRHAAPGACAKQSFARAIQLARLVFHDLESTLQAAEAALALEHLQRSLPAPGLLPAPAPASPNRSPNQPQTVSRRAGDRARGRRPAPRPGGSGLASVPDAAAAPTPSANGHHRQHLVQRMLDYIHANYSHPVQLHDLAAAMNLNASYASSVFSATLGITFHQYLQEFRLARAKDLLRDPLKRISEVAYSVGYSNPNHFRNAFTGHVGLPPSAWRDTAEAAPLTGTVQPSKR